MFPVVFLFLVEAVTPNAALFSFSSLNNLRASVYTAVSAERASLTHSEELTVPDQHNTTKASPLRVRADVIHRSQSYWRTYTFHL